MSSTFSLLCFAFYHQVLLMPLLSEMPVDDDESARFNARNVGMSSTITLLGTAGFTYWVTGFFGAAV